MLGVHSEELEQGPRQTVPGPKPCRTGPSTWLGEEPAQAGAPCRSRQKALGLEIQEIQGQASNLVSTVMQPRGQFGLSGLAKTLEPMEAEGTWDLQGCSAEIHQQVAASA